MNIGERPLFCYTTICHQCLDSKFKIQCSKFKIQRKYVIYIYNSQVIISFKYIYMFRLIISNIQLPEFWNYHKQ